MYSGTKLRTSENPVDKWGRMKLVGISEMTGNNDSYNKTGWLRESNRRRDYRKLPCQSRQRSFMIQALSLPVEIRQF